MSEQDWSRVPSPTTPGAHWSGSPDGGATICTCSIGDNHARDDLGEPVAGMEFDGKVTDEWANQVTARMNAAVARIVANGREQGRAEQRVADARELAHALGQGEPTAWEDLLTYIRGAMRLGVALQRELEAMAAMAAAEQEGQVRDERPPDDAPSAL